MKYLKSFSALNESNRFLHMKEVLDTIDDMCLDLKDEGFKIMFGTMPTAISNPSFANFDENLDDLAIKTTSLGRRVIYVKFDIDNNKDFRSDEKILELFINTITSVYNYLVSEDLLINGLWTKELVVRNRNDHGKNEFFYHQSIDELVNTIDWLREERLSGMVSTINNIKMKKRSNIDFSYLLDARISFMGQPLLDESIQISESDVDDINDIIDDFNSEYADEGQYHIKAELSYGIINPKMRRGFSGTKSSVGQYVVVISDRTSSYDGFQFHECVPLVLRLMSKFEVDQIELGILNIHEPGRKFKTFNKQQLESYLDKNYLMDQVSNISISLEI